MLTYCRVSVKFRDKEIKPLMFGPLDGDQGDKELLRLGPITERAARIVERVNRSTALSVGKNSLDRFVLHVDLREEADPKLPAITVHQLMVEQYLVQLEEALFSYDPPIFSIDFNLRPNRLASFFEKIGKIFGRMGETHSVL